MRGNVGEVNRGYSVIHVGDPLVDPDDGAIVGFQGIFVGEGTITRGGDPATLRIVQSNREALEGDRLLEQDFDIPLQFIPRAPDADVDGRIIHVVDGLALIGQYQVVVLNRGANTARCRHVLSIFQAGPTVRDRIGRRLGRDAGRIGRYVDDLQDVRADQLCADHGSDERDPHPRPGQEANLIRNSRNTRLVDLFNSPLT